ncbi:histidine kinase N-terminal domain-containing protein [Bacillus cereus]|nr:histidine kinase N-terminal domain-containing protein [Bacillus cereus]
MNGVEVINNSKKEVEEIMGEIDQILCLYLKENPKKVVADWQKNILVHENDPYAEQIIKNGERLLTFFIEYLKEEISLQDIKMISKKIAQERAEAGVNIAEFIYNTNIAKKQIMDIVSLLTPNLQQYQLLTNKVNAFFENLIYYTIYSYYELK